jgi:hypothetical protein
MTGYKNQSEAHKINVAKNKECLTASPLHRNQGTEGAE